MSKKQTTRNTNNKRVTVNLSTLAQLAQDETRWVLNDKAQELADVIRQMCDKEKARLDGVPESFVVSCATNGNGSE